MGLYSVPRLSAVRRARPGASVSNAPPRDRSGIDATSANLARDVDLRTRRDMDDEGRHGLIPAPWAATCFGPPRDWAVSRRRRRARDRRIWTSTDRSRGSRPRIAQVTTMLLVERILRSGLASRGESLDQVAGLPDRTT